MKRLLRMLATTVAVSVAALWITLGRNRGWTKTSVAVLKKDPVTDLDYREYEKRFVPGVDLLALGLAGAASLWALSFAFRRAESEDGPPTHHPPSALNQP